MSWQREPLSRNSSISQSPPSKHLAAPIRAAFLFLQLNLKNSFFFGFDKFLQKPISVCLSFVLTISEG